MIPVSTLYDEYIDRPKLTEQKNPFEYIVPPPPPPQEGSEQSKPVTVCVRALCFKHLVCFIFFKFALHRYFYRFLNKHAIGVCLRERERES